MPATTKRNAFELMAKAAKKRKDKKEVVTKPAEDVPRHSEDYHHLSISEQSSFTEDLLAWYSKSAAVMPWRVPPNQKTSLCDSVYAYQILVSEIMCQQTQVKTASPYFERWVKKWPDFEALSKATLEEVHEMWKGLGFYRRAGYLHNAAIMVMEKFNGEFPSNPADMKQLPGVGPYCMGSLQSLIYNRRTPAVDGNFLRVFSRVKALGTPDTKLRMKIVTLQCEKLIDSERPGDWNQAVMDLGSRVCSPKSPQCSICPISKYCRALKESQNVFDTSTATDIEDISCSLCSEWDGAYSPTPEVTKYPNIVKTTTQRTEVVKMAVISVKVKDEVFYLVTKRPKKGLLAGLWEFVPFKESSTEALQSLCETPFDVETSSRADVLHVFTHIRMTIKVQAGQVKLSKLPILSTANEIKAAALSTCAMKVFKSATSPRFTS